MDMDLLRYHIAKCGFSIAEMAETLGVSPSTLSRKLGEETEFNRNEIKLLKDRLNLSPEEVNCIFFG